MSIGSDVCCGKFSEIVISDEITTVKKWAFRKAAVKSVCWSNGCNSIPEEYFLGSSVRYISNIYNVKKIGDGASAQTRFKEFFWPDMCKEIPAKCFDNSYLERFFGKE